MNLKNDLSCKYLLTLLTNSSTEATSLDPDQTAPILNFFEQEASKTFRQTTKSD